MITNTGKGILAKYLIGQTSSYASYIAIGCGAKPRFSLGSTVIAKAWEYIPEVSGTVTLTTSTAHGMSVGDTVMISGVGVIGNPAISLDGYQVVTSTPAANKIEYSLARTSTTVAEQSSTGTIHLDFSYKKSLDFEMFRVPIISRGYVVENGVAQVVLTAELPTDDRYEISEIGIYSASANPSATVYDSKILNSFSTQEKWEYHSAQSSNAIPVVTRSLDNGTNYIADDNLQVFQANADNAIFLSPDRVSRKEKGRFINNSIFIRGDNAILSKDADSNLFLNSGNHVHLNGINFNLDGNASTDKVKLAFSVVTRQGATPSSNYASAVEKPTHVRVLVEFVSSEKTSGGAEFANLEVDLIDGENGVDFSANRYFVIEEELGNIHKSNGFTWAGVQTTKISACVYNGATENPNPDLGISKADQYFIALDGIRLENETSINPLYGLTGYTILKNNDASTVVKQKNTTNFVEFRFGFGNEV